MVGWGICSYCIKRYELFRLLRCQLLRSRIPGTIFREIPGNSRIPGNIFLTSWINGKKETYGFELQLKEVSYQWDTSHEWNREYFKEWRQNLSLIYHGDDAYTSMARKYTSLARKYTSLARKYTSLPESIPRFWSILFFYFYIFLRKS